MAIRDASLTGAVLTVFLTPVDFFLETADVFFAVLGIGTVPYGVFPL